MCLCCSIPARRGAGAGLVPCDLGTPVPTARVCSEVPADEVSQLQGSPSHPVALHHTPWLSITSSWLSITSSGSPSCSMAPHHIPWLSTTLHHIPWLSIILPCLSSLYFSRPAPLLLYHPPPHKHAQSHQPRRQPPPRPQEGLWGSQATSSHFAHGPVLGGGFSCSRPAATSSPNLPLCWPSTLQRGPVPPCPSPQHFCTLQTRSSFGGLISISMGPRRIAMDTCRNCIGSATALLGRAGAGSYHQAVTKC